MKSLSATGFSPPAGWVKSKHPILFSIQGGLDWGNAGGGGGGILVDGEGPPDDAWTGGVGLEFNSYLE